MNTKKLILTALFTAITAVSAQILIPTTPAPFTLQTLAVFLSAIVLGAKYGAISQAVYALIGAVGLPVFAGGEGGLGVIAGPKGGYILGFILAAWIVGFLVTRKKAPSRLELIGFALIGDAVCLTVGTFWLGFVLRISALQAIAVGVTPFIIFDVIKIVIAGFVGFEVRKALVKASLI